MDREAGGRPLGHSERAILLLDRAACLNFVVVAELSGPLAIEAVRSGLDAAQARHPLARARIGGSLRRGPVFVPCGRPLPLRVVDGAQEDWVSQAEAEMRAPIPIAEGPLVRATFLSHGPRAGTLLVAFHHAAGDGTSGVLFVRDLIQAAGESCEGRSPDVQVLPLERCLEDHVPLPFRGARGIGRLARMFAGELLVLARVGLRRALPVDQDVPHTACRPRLLARTMDRASTTRLIQKSRAERTTVHGALMAGLLLALGEEIGGGAPVALCCGSPVSLRGEMQPPVGEDLGFFALMARSTHRVGPSGSLWDLAREVHHELKRTIDRGDPFLLGPGFCRAIAVLAAVTSLHETRLVRFIERASLTVTGITNLGALTVGTRAGPLDIRSLHFAVAPFVLTRLMATATTFDGVLRVNFSYQEPSLSEARVRRVVDAAMKKIAGAIT